MQYCFINNLIKDFRIIQWRYSFTRKMELKSIEKSLKEEIKEIMKSCDIFKNIHRIRSKAQRTKIKKNDSPPKAPFNAKIEIDLDMLKDFKEQSQKKNLIKEIKIKIALIQMIFKIMSKWI